MGFDEEPTAPGVGSNVGTANADQPSSMVEAAGPGMTEEEFPAPGGEADVGTTTVIGNEVAAPDIVKDGRSSGEKAKYEETKQPYERNLLERKRSHGNFLAGKETAEKAKNFLA